MNRTFGVLVAAAAAALLTVSACASGSGGDGGEASGGTVTAGVVQSWTGFNPYVPDQANVTGMALANAIYPSAFGIRSDMSVEMNDDLLDSAKVVSKHPQTVLYEISDAAIWADGEPITAADFSYLWHHLNGESKTYQVTSTIGYSEITSVKAAGDDKTVEVVFDSPFADWRSLFSPLLPAHYMDSLGSDADAWNTGLIEDTGPAGGPFAVTDNAPGEYVTLSRNPKWYGTPASLESVTVRHFGDAQSEVQALASGELEIGLDIQASSAQVEQLGAIDGIETEIVATGTKQFLTTQFGRGPTDDLSVRRALAVAVDPEALAGRAYGKGLAEEVVTSHHIYPPFSSVVEDNRPAGYGTGDVDAAARILEDAGWSMGSDGIYVKDGNRLTIDFAVSPGDEIARQVAVVLQQTLEEAGMDLAVRTVVEADYFETLVNGDFNLNLGGYPESAFPASWYAALYTCEGGYNFAGYCNDEVDRIFTQAGKELDPDRQAELLNQADEILWEDVANIPMFQIPDLVGISSGLDGVDVQLPLAYQFLDAANWEASS